MLWYIYWMCQLKERKINDDIKIVDKSGRVKGWEIFRRTAKHTLKYWQVWLLIWRPLFRSENHLIVFGIIRLQLVCEMIEGTTYYTILFRDVPLAADNLDFPIDSLSIGNIYVKISKLKTNGTYHSSVVCSETFNIPTSYRYKYPQLNAKLILRIRLLPNDYCTQFVL